MFSRTTIASSMSNPIARERASSVIVFNVNLNTHMMKNAEMIDAGSGYAVAHSNGDGGEGARIYDAPADADELLGCSVRNRASRHFLILPLQRLCHLDRTDVIGAHGARVKLNLNLPAVATVDIDA